MELTTEEADRLAALYMYGVLDTDFEERFDRLTRVAAAVFGTPISLISLIDKDRQWFKSSLGLETRQTARDISFCTHAIQHPEVFVVGDAKQDARFRANPLVTGNPHIRFYAGAPLITSKGYALGTFCVIDREPRADFSAAEQALLQDFAATVVDFFELQRTMRDSRAKRVLLEGELREMAAEAAQLGGTADSPQARDELSALAERLKRLAD